MSKHDDDTCPHLVRASLLEAENARLKAEVEMLTRKLEVADNHAQCLEMVINAGTANELRLKAEVERLKAVSTIEQRTIQGLQQTPEWSEIARLTAECRRLEAENNRLRSSSFVTAVPVEQYERVVKAGDDMAFHYQELVRIEWGPMTTHTPPSVVRWLAAKEGKPSV